MSDLDEVSTSALLSHEAARRLHAFATALFVVVTVFAIFGVVGGGVTYILWRGDPGKEAGVALTLAISSLATWLTVSVPIVAAQAVARYIQFRVSLAAFDDDDSPD